MPTYDFINKETKEIHSKLMHFSEREEYLSKNPELEVIFLSSPATCDSYTIGVKKPDSGFQEVLSKIIERTPSATALNRHLSRSTQRSY